jgi:DNA adenine methylase
MSEINLEPLLKWPGGKEQELPIILNNKPTFNRYFEPFVGGGAVYFNIDAKEYFINDKSEELVLLYDMIKGQKEELFLLFDSFIKSWSYLREFTIDNFDLFVQLYNQFCNNDISFAELAAQLSNVIHTNTNLVRAINILGVENDLVVIETELFDGLVDKMKRMSSIEKKLGKLSSKDLLDNFETGIKGGYYMYFRYRYNHNSLDSVKRTFLFFFIRNYAYSGMFRYNKKMEFNVPYGGIGYNSKNLIKKVRYYSSSELNRHLSKTTISNADFETFLLKFSPKKDDFIFLDPPYDTEFSTYANNSFGREEQVRLSEYLTTNCLAKWMLIIKKTDFILSLYEDKDLFINSFDKKYLVSFMNRNDKDVQHLLITNYSINK